MDIFETYRSVLSVPIYFVKQEPDWVKTYQDKYGVFLDYDLKKNRETDKTEWMEIAIRQSVSGTLLFEVRCHIGRYSMEDEGVHEILEKAMLKYVTEEFEDGKTYLEKDKDASYYDKKRFAKIWIEGWQDEKPYKAEGIFVFNTRRFVWERIGTPRIEQVSPVGVVKTTDLVKRKNK